MKQEYTCAEREGVIIILGKMTRCDVTLPSSYVDILTRVFYSYPLRERIIIILGKMMRCDVTLPSSDVDILTRVFYIPAEREGKHNFARYTKNYGRIQCTLYWVKKKKQVWASATIVATI